MLRKLPIFVLSASLVLSAWRAHEARAQSDDSAEEPATLGDRLGRFGRTILGTPNEEDRARQRRSSQQEQQRSAQQNVPRKAGQQQPSSSEPFDPFTESAKPTPQTTAARQMPAKQSQGQPAAARRSSVPAQVAGSGQPTSSRRTAGQYGATAPNTTSQAASTQSPAPQAARQQIAQPQTTAPRAAAQTATKGGQPALATPRSMSPRSNQQMSARPSARPGAGRVNVPEVARRNATPPVEVATEGADSAEVAVEGEADEVEVSPAPDEQELAAEPKAVPEFDTPAPIARPTSATAPKTASSREDGENLISTRSSPVLALETVGPRQIVLDQPATYKVVLRNGGDMAASGVTVAVGIPSWAEVVDATPTAGVTQAARGGQELEGIVWKLKDLAAHGKDELVLEIVPHKSERLELALQVSHAPVAAQATVEVQEPKLQLVLTGSNEARYGEKEVYRIKISNPGTGSAQNVKITLAPISAGDEQTEHAIGTIAAGEEKIIEVELVARQTGTIPIHIEATADGGLTASLAEEILVRRAELAIELAGAAQQYAGTPASYEVHLSNKGNAEAEQIEVTCQLPEAATYVSSTHSGTYDESRRAIVWTVDRVDAEAEMALGFSCSLESEGTNRFEAEVAAPGGLADRTEATTQVMLVADLVLAVNDPSGPMPTGTEVEYEVVVRNRGTKSAERIEITAYFSDGIEPIAVDGARFDLSPGTVVIEPLATLGAGEERSFRIKARAEAAGNHRFRAELVCKPLGTSLTQQETTLFYAATAAAPAADMQ